MIGAATPAELRRLKLALLATAAVWGANVTAVKLLLQWFDPLIMSMLRVLLSASVLMAVAFWPSAGGSAPWPRLPRRAWVALVLCGVLSVYLNQLCFAWGVGGTAAANAALILALNPLGSALGAAWLLRERLSPRRLLGIALGFGGVAAVVLNRPGVAFGSAGLGDLLMLGTVATWVGGGLIVQWLARLGEDGLDTQRLSALVTVAGAVPLGLHVLLDPGSRLPAAGQVPWAGWLLLAASGLLAMAWGAVVWNRGVKILGAQRTSLFTYWVPVFGVAFAVGVLGEPLSVWHAIGLAAVLAGTWLGTRR